MIVYKNRASSILYEFLASNKVRINKAFLPANTCEVVPMVYLKIGIPIEFIDMSVSTFCMDIDDLEGRIVDSKNEITIIHYIRNFGYQWKDDEKKLKKIKKKFNNIIIIDDRCLCKPEIIENDSIFDIELYSTGYAKYLDLGGGGFAFLSNNVKYEKKNTKIPQNTLCKNNSFNNLSCGNSSLKKIIKSNWLEIKNLKNEDLYIKKINSEKKKIEKHKNELNKIYMKNLPRSIQLYPKMSDWRFNIIIENNDLLIQELFANNLFASKHFQSLGNGYFTNEIFHKIDSVSKKIVNLFNDKYYTKQMAVKTVKIINQYLKNDQF